MMKASVNLTIDEGLLAKVKRYASNQQGSLSEWVESYLKTLGPPLRKSRVDMAEELPPPTIQAAPLPFRSVISPKAFVVLVNRQR